MLNAFDQSQMLNLQSAFAPAAQIPYLRPPVDSGHPAPMPVPAPEENHSTHSATYDATGRFKGMSKPAMNAFNTLASKWGDLKINSAYRDPEHNKRVGGANKSQHIHGNAFDLDVSHLSREERGAMIRDAKAAGFRGVGVYNNALHFDVGPERAWGSNYHRDSLPEWAAPYL